MKLLIILSSAVLITAAPPPPTDAITTNKAQEKVSLLKSNFNNDGLGIYRYAYEQSDGTKQDQEGELKNKDIDDEAPFVKGSFTWIGPDGVTYTIRYEAGVDGYRPEIEQGPGGSIPADVAATMIG